MRRQTWMITAILLGLALLSFGCSPGFTPAEGLQPGKMAPDFRLTSVDGQEVSLSAYRGSPVLLNFWASWCPPCKAEMPFIQEVFADGQWSARGLVILAVDIGESSATVKQFLADNGYSFTVLLDTGQDVAQEYNVRGIPTTFFIDRGGIIRDIAPGAFSGRDEIERRLGKIVP